MSKIASLASVIPIPWSAMLHELLPPPVIISAPIRIIPVTPEGQVIPASNVAVTAVHLTESFSGSEGATIIAIYRTTLTTRVTVPGDAISELVPKLVIKLLKVLPPVQLLVSSSHVLKLSSLRDTLI